MRIILDNTSFRDCWLLYIICGNERSGQLGRLAKELGDLRIVQQGEVACGMKDRSKGGGGKEMMIVRKIPNSDDLVPPGTMAGKLARETTPNGRAHESSG